MCSGRDVRVSVEGNKLEIETQLSALEVKVPQFLVATNCDDDRFRKLHTPPAERFKFSLPADVIPGGKHTMLVDPSGEFFGIKLQKLSKFQNQVMVQSKRSRETDKLREEEIKKKLQIGTQFLDDGAKKLFYESKLKELLDKTGYRSELDLAGERYRDGDSSFIRIEDEDARALLKQRLNIDDDVFSESEHNDDDSEIYSFD